MFKKNFILFFLIVFSLEASVQLPDKTDSQFKNLAKSQKANYSPADDSDDSLELEIIPIPKKSEKISLDQQIEDEKIENEEAKRNNKDISKNILSGKNNCVISTIFFFILLVFF